MMSYLRFVASSEIHFRTATSQMFYGTISNAPTVYVLGDQTKDLHKRCGEQHSLPTSDDSDFPSQVRDIPDGIEF